MPPPEFNKSTINTLGRRAGFKCSNPDCRVSTVGPNSDPQKSTLIGEAAHIYGARRGSKRYIASMTDNARAEITNAIWLCCNCHKLIDTDERKFSSNILFAWRETHESYIQSELGTVGDRIRFEDQQLTLTQFENCPPIVRRILIDRPNCWEWRLTAELMRHLNRHAFHRITDLREGLYTKPLQNVGDDSVGEWFKICLLEGQAVIKPIAKLMDRLTMCFGEPGSDGDAERFTALVA